MTKLRENEFYLVRDRKKIRIPKEDIDVVTMDNTKRKGGVPALRGWYEDGELYLYNDNKPSLIKKYGEGYY